MDEPTKIGPHLLGRKYVADDRDWGVDKLHANLATASAPIDPMLDKTVREVAATLVSWRQVLAFASALWTWIRHHVSPTPPPTPPPAPTPADSPAWYDGVVLDQGNYGTCVGNGWAGWGDCLPVADSYTERDARAIYYESTVIDGHPDDPDAPGGGQEGSSVRAGAKAMKARGRLSAYAFATTMAQVDEWLDNHGPVVWGTDWTSDMFNPDADGVVSATGPVEGGHCFLNVDKLYHPTRGKLYECVNSWGTGWAKGGHFFIKEADFARLLAAQGDACLALELLK